MDEQFKVLFVCTGNICRSPMAEQMLRQMLKQNGIENIHIESAGTWAMTGQDLPEDAKIALREADYQVENHVAKQLEPQAIEGVNLVLTATEEHRSEVVKKHVKANRYAFTIREFARLAAFVENPGETEFHVEPTSTFTEKLQLLASARGYAENLGNINLADPYMHPLEHYKAVQQQLEEDLQVVTRWLAHA